ncbi:MAG TPA: DUF6782 family putative metallopeptidase [Jiangellaceae bacterium]
MLATVLAFIGGLLVGGAAVGVVWFARSASGEPSYESAADVLPAELPNLIEFVEAERGLTFLEEVDIDVVDDDEFERALLAPEPEDGGSVPVDYGSTYAALGLTPDAETYYRAEQSVYTDYLAGYYDPETRQLLVRGREWTPDVEATVVHELVHALQDQQFELGVQFDELSADDEAALALRAIVEGDASRIEYAYVDEQDAQWQEAYDEAYANVQPSGPYDPMADFVGWLPYWLGTTAVETLVEIGGNDAVDQAFEDPPTTSEQLLNIAAWHEGDEDVSAAVEVAEPDVPDGAVVLDSGTIGVALLSTFPLTFEDEFFPSEFLAGWRGDSYVTWRNDDSVCTTVTAAFDEEGDVSAATDVLRPWVDRTGAELDRVDEGDAGPGLILESCTE